jgi:myo-inositol-1(or 4)-monophosphatase
VPINNDLLHAATEAAQRAARFIRETGRPSDPASWGRKGISDFVTHVDRESEMLIAAQLHSRFPGSTIIGEELTPDAATADLVWVVDPLDGTTNYLHEYPAYAVSIAAIADGQLAAGVVLDISRDRLYSAAAGSGAWCDSTPIKVSDTNQPASALIGTGYPFKALDLLPEYLRQFSTVLQQTSGIRRAGSAALDLADVAQGRFDGFWELTLAPWDIAAGALLVREAGGVITNLDGGTEIVRHGSIVAGNPAMHRWLMRTLSVE